MRMFRFTSTTMHVISNVRNITYLHNSEIEIVHAAHKNIMMITPNKNVTLNNYLTESDIDVGDIRRQLQNNDNLVVIPSNNKGSAEYYKLGNSKSKSALQNLCQGEGIAYTDKSTRQQLAESLA